jgi:hypothetical protein
METFYDWLLKRYLNDISTQRYSYTPKMLALDMQYDKENNGRSPEINTLNYLLTCLIEGGACDECLECFFKCWLDYKNEVK